MRNHIECAESKQEIHDRGGGEEGRGEGGNCMGLYPHNTLLTEDSEGE
jgi:hypothetical protein